MTLEESKKDPWKAFEYGEKCCKENKFGEGIFWMRDALGNVGNQEPNMLKTYEKYYSSLSPQARMNVDLFQLYYFNKLRGKI